MHRHLFILAVFLHLSVCTVYAQKRIGVVVREIKQETGNRLLVTGTIARGPAEKAGIQPGDTIMAVGGIPVHSIYSLQDQVQMVAKDSLAVVLIVRNGRPYTLQMLAEQAPAKIMRIHRINSAPWGTYDYKVYVNDQLIGEIAAEQTQDFVINETANKQYRLFVYCKSLLGYESYSDTVELGFKPNRLTYAEFTAGDGNFPIHVSFRLTDSLTAAMHNDSLARQAARHLDSLNRAAVARQDSAIQAAANFKSMLAHRDYNTWRYITCDSSLAPRFFKWSTRTSMDGVISDRLRQWFFRPLLQCRAVYRLLLLAFILCVLCGLVKHELWGIMPVITLLSYPLSWFIAWLLNEIIYDGPRYIPYEFVYFCMLAVLIIGSVVHTVKPLYQILTHHKHHLEKALGYLGACFGIFEIIKTVYEILEMVKPYW